MKDDIPVKDVVSRFGLSRAWGLALALACVLAAVAGLWVVLN